MTPILQIQHLTKTFGTRTILAGLSAVVEAGTSLAVTGPSGCGKSTLLNIIGMLEPPTSGTVLLQGRPLPPVNSGAATRLRRTAVNYLFQSFALIPDRSVTDNALLALHHVRASKQDKQAQVLDVLARLSLSHVREDRVSTLSGGEQQRLALARCILKPGDLILADEPTGALDRHLADAVAAEMFSLQRDYGKTLLVVTHDPTLAARCDAALELRPQS